MNVHGLNSGGNGGGGGGPSGGFGGFGSGMGGAGGQGGSCTDQIKAWWQTVPVFTRVIFWAVLAIYLLTWIPGLKILPYFFIMLRPDIFWFGYHFWTLATGTLFSMSIFTVLFGYLAYIPLAAQREREVGTVKAGAFWFLNSVLVNIIFVILAMLVSPIFPKTFVMPLSGLWPLFMVELFIECNKNPEAPRMLCCLPCQFQSRQFPWVILAFFSLISLLLGGFVPVDILAGTVVGYLHTLEKLEFSKISDSRAQQLEKKICNSCVNHAKYVGLNGSQSEVSGSGFAMPGTVGNQPFQSSSANTTTSAPAANNNTGSNAFKAFGGQGRTLGSSDVAAPRGGDRYDKLYEDNSLGLEEDPEK
mmetsp:Transcript_1838/g.1937  ORF Transcript_1838/g.1937 Transcript_1838/m.1937 type:complete len:360 (-) Transcript_1838:147-1226(-)|eukprot:CAMPEP_0114997638 /NCGR_PEP_ID=MMETSP0216-20121206/15015_1 /TAXON_ID=223996 /ORGANISM="Protocruzia adherens, Strain Boccale" /LENGTH=359 /DNA_ID=CAMNT_0002362051 /DNA_START=255 /DNA_END=1334 /DNA_ORIENTATION=+